MNMLIKLHNSLSDRASAAAPWLLPTLARAAFAAVLLGYFWRSAMTKLGPGPLGFLMPSDGAYIQIFPRAMEAATYNSANLGLFHWAVVTAGTLAEFILPLLIVVGLLTRLASLGMIGFVAVQSLTDIYGHGVGGADLGAWFDGASGALILDQRTLWVVLLAVPVLHGAGPLSLDRLLAGPRRTGYQPTLPT